MVGYHRGRTGAQITAGTSRLIKIKPKAVFSGRKGILIPQELEGRSRQCAFCNSITCLEQAVDPKFGIYETFASPENTLFRRIFTRPHFRHLYTSYMKLFLTQVIKTSQAPVTLNQFHQLTEFLVPQFERDGFVDLMGHRNSTTLPLWNAMNEQWFPLRWNYVRGQLENY